MWTDEACGEGIERVSWMVTGGAGYIGAHVVRALTGRGLDVVVLDDLSSGHRRFVPESVPLVEASVLDTGAVAETLSRHGVVGVVHVAGFKYANAKLLTVNSAVSNGSLPAGKKLVRKRTNNGAITRKLVISVIRGRVSFCCVNLILLTPSVAACRLAMGIY